MEVTRAETTEQIDAARRLFREYATTPGVAECVVGFEREVAALPGRYQVILLGMLDGAAEGCAALRPLNETTCEMKRLYVRPAARGTGLGRRLTEALMAEAKALGYVRMRLDTLPSMASAQALYRSLGFVEIGRYSEDSPPAALYFEFDLRAQ